MRIDEQQAKAFRDSLVSAAERICPQYGVNVEECVRAAAEATCFGKFAIHNNYFNIVGNGDKGHNIYIRSDRTGDALNGGMEPKMVRLARFSTPEAAVHAYCRSNRQ